MSEVPLYKHIYPPMFWQDALRAWLQENRLFEELAAPLFMFGVRTMEDLKVEPETATLSPAPCILHPEPCTLHPAPCTLHPAP